MRIMECRDCGCIKSLHRIYKKRIICFGCWEIYRDNKKEFMATMKVWLYHNFKMDNLKWLEQQYEKTLKV